MTTPPAPADGLEQWMADHHPDILRMWEVGPSVLLDLDEWLGLVWPDVLKEWKAAQ